MPSYLLLYPYIRAKTSNSTGMDVDEGCRRIIRGIANWAPETGSTALFICLFICFIYLPQPLPFTGYAGSHYSTDCCNL